MLKLRIIFGPIMIAALLGLMFLDQHLSYIDLTGTFAQSTLNLTHLPPGIVIFCLISLLMIPAVLELKNIFAGKQIACYPIIAVPATLAVIAALYLQANANILATIAIIGFFASLLYHIRHKQIDGALAAGGATMLIIVYLGFMPGMFLAFRAEHAAWELFGIIMITKACDTGAYFTGRFCGKHKLIPWLSPKKTIEGLAGGIVLSIIVALALNEFATGTSAMQFHELQDATWTLTNSSYSTTRVVITGLLLALVGHAGDLLMSLFKRDANAKDSGSSIPGFGGVMDVLDSPILIAPVAYWILH